MGSIFSRNIKYLREEKDLGQLELAHLLGRKSGSSVSEWEKGTYTPKSGTLSDLSRIFNVNLHDLMNEDLTKPNNVKMVSPQSIQIPVLGVIACGDPIIAEENISGYRSESPDTLPAGDLFYLETKGDSMEPTIPNGSHVLIREQSEVEYGEIAAVLVNGGTEATLKRVTRQGDTVLLMPINSSYEPIVITEDNPARIIGKAIRFTQDL
ncbi:MAG TPA: XRE family transcriptional regulator [Virgibacillus sp.]|nr:XRE family transcriptional regulator [Virgibacillus sp.]